MIPNVGKPLDRVDGRPKTTGRARYAAEHNLENTVQVARDGAEALEILAAGDAARSRTEQAAAPA